MQFSRAPKFLHFFPCGTGKLSSFGEPRSATVCRALSRTACVDSRVLDLALIWKRHQRHEWRPPRTKGHVIASARAAFLLDVVCYSSNFPLAVLDLSTTKCGWNISWIPRFFVFRRVCNDDYQIQRLLLAGWADFVPSCCPLEAERSAQYFVNFMLIFLLTECLGEFQKLFVTSFQKYLANYWVDFQTKTQRMIPTLCCYSAL